MNANMGQLVVHRAAKACIGGCIIWPPRTYIIILLWLPNGCPKAA